MYVMELQFAKVGLPLFNEVQQILRHANRVAQDESAHHIRAATGFVSDLGELRSP